MLVPISFIKGQQEAKTFRIVAIFFPFFDHVSPVPPLYLWRFRYLRFMSTSDPSLRPLLQSWHSKGQSSHIGLAGIRVRCFSCSCPIGLTGNAGTAVTPVARLSPYHLAWHARLAFRSISYMPLSRLLSAPI